MSDDLARLGAAAVLRKEIIAWRARASSHRSTLVSASFVLHEIEDLNVDQIEQLAHDLAGCVREIRTRKQRLAELGEMA